MVIKHVLIHWTLSLYPVNNSKACKCHIFKYLIVIPKGDQPRKLHIILNVKDLHMTSES